MIGGSASSADGPIESQIPTLEVVHSVIVIVFVGIYSEISSSPTQIISYEASYWVNEKT